MPGRSYQYAGHAEQEGKMRNAYKILDKTTREDA
jgi:hypothetical protein